MNDQTRKMLQDYLDSTAADLRTAEDAARLIEEDEALEISASRYMHGGYKGAEVMLTYGGPTVWIDTHAGVLKGSWGSARLEKSLPAAFTNALDDHLADIFA